LRGLRWLGRRAVVRAPLVLAILITVVLRPIAIRLVAEIRREPCRVLTVPGLLLLRLPYHEGGSITRLPGSFITPLVRRRLVSCFAMARKAYCISQHRVHKGVVIDSLLEVWLQASVKDGKRHVIFRQSQVCAEHLQPLCKVAD
jgi:hypothetical protein